jgi:trehalose 6-phosphate synthase
MTGARNRLLGLLGFAASLALVWLLAHLIGERVTFIPASFEADSAGLVTFVQSTQELAARTSVARSFLFLIFALIVGAAWLLYLASTRRHMRKWVSDVRGALRSQHAAPEFTPLVKELPQVLRPVPAADGAARPASAVVGAARALPAADSAVLPAGHWTRDRLKRLLTERLNDDHVIVVANREPFIHERTEDGSIKVIQPASGLVTALDPVMRASSGVWIAHGSGTADREASDAHDRLRVPPGEESYTLRRVWLTEEEEEGFYYGFANEGLWPLCHLVHVRPSFRAADWAHYGVVNRRFANAVSEEASRDDPIVLVHDYHFALAPRFVRQLLPNATIIAFWHIPWPNPERFGISPWREELLEGLLGADIIGFHTQAHCNNFLDTVDAYLESRVDRGDGTVTRRGHTTVVRPYPISIEWPLRILNGMPSVAECRCEVLRELGLREDTILAIGVDRLDYTKGLVERMQAVEALLEASPDLRGRFVFVQLAAPSRIKILRYRELDEEVRDAAARINARFGTEGYTPVRFIKGHHSPRHIMRLFRAANICYVSSLHDGMNLVAKEFVAGRDDERGALVLSQFAGASREFTEALIVNPYDLEKAAAALDKAARMSVDEQRARMHAMRSQLAEFNVYRWAGRMLADASSLRKRVRDPAAETWSSHEGITP